MLSRKWDVLSFFFLQKTVNDKNIGIDNMRDTWYEVGCFRAISKPLRLPYANPGVTLVYFTYCYYFTMIYDCPS